MSKLVTISKPILLRASIKAKTEQGAIELYREYKCLDSIIKLVQEYAVVTDDCNIISFDIEEKNEMELENESRKKQNQTD